MGIPHLHVSCKCDVCLSLEKCDGNYVVCEVSSKTTVGFQASSLPYLRRLQVWVYPLVMVSGPGLQPPYAISVATLPIQTLKRIPSYMELVSILTENEMQVRMAILPEIVHKWY